VPRESELQKKCSRDPSCKNTGAINLYNSPFFILTLFFIYRSINIGLLENAITIELTTNISKQYIERFLFAAISDVF